MRRTITAWFVLVACGIALCMALFSACGSSSDNTTTVPHHDAGAASGWYFQRVQVGDQPCILATNKYDNNVGFSCDWATTQPTTPTTTTLPSFAP